MDFITGSYPFVSNYINEHIDPLKKMDFDLEYPAAVISPEFDAPQAHSHRE
jgi:hypothetical protein